MANRFKRRLEALNDPPAESPTGERTPRELHGRSEPSLHVAASHDAAPSSEEDHQTFWLDSPEPSDIQAPDMSPDTRKNPSIQESREVAYVGLELTNAQLRTTAKPQLDELKVNFLARYGNEAVRLVLFLGTSRGDGASTAASNFAMSLAEDEDTRVLLINADLRSPALHDVSEHPVGTGLANLAHPEAQLPLPARNGNLYFVGSGFGQADPSVLFQSKRFNAFLAQVTQQFDYVVIDGPPLDEAPESIALSATVDGVILVIDARNTRRKIALRAKKRVEEVGGKLLGIVLNHRKYHLPAWLYRII